MMKDIVHTRVVSTLLIVICIILSAGVSGYLLDLYDVGGVSANEPPVADAGDGPIYGYPTVPITFNGTGSTDLDGEIVSYEWTFGDGYTGIGLTPTHTYELPGTYNVVLTVTDNDGAKDTDGIDVVISEDTEGTGMYTLVTVNELLVNGTAWYGKLVRVAYATVSDAGSFDSGYGSDPSGWVKFSISDTSTTQSIDVYCQGGANRPLDLKQGDMVNVSALMDKYGGAWELNVRADTLDKVTLCPAIYNLYTLGELLGDRLGHYGELVRLENLEIVSTWSYGWVVTDDTTNETVSLYAEMNANVSQYVNVSDLVTVQGLFTYYDYDNDGPDLDEWEIKVRNAAEDMVLRTYEFDYPPVIASITRSPQQPSAYDEVTINASVSDNVHLDSVVLHYAVNGGTDTGIAMGHTAGTYYAASIPAQPAGSNVTYWVSATDNLGQETVSGILYYVTVDSPPVIEDMGQEPEWVRPSDTVVVWAALSDDGGIASASVVYTTDGWNTSTTVPMLNDGNPPDANATDSIFTATLGSFTEGTLVEYYVEVADTIGQNVTSANVSFVSSYDQPPIFGGVYRDMEMPSEADAVTIIANVTDDFQLVSVVLVYDAGSGYVEVNMSQRADGNWVAEIPAQPKLTPVSYYVNATDNASHVVSYPSTPQSYLVGYGVPSILYATGHGEYSGAFDRFAGVVAQQGYYFVEDDINNVDLDWVEFVIINDPDSQYTPEELAKLQAYVQNGGGLLILSETDYNDYGKPENVNPILEYLGIQGRINDDGFQDEYYCWNYPTYGGAYGDTDYSQYSEHIPYFNYLHRGPNGTYVAGDYEDWGCFANDTTGITSGFASGKMWMEGRSVCTIYNASGDIVIVRGSDYGYNVNNDLTQDHIEEAYYYSYPKNGQPGHVAPPIMAAHEGIGTGRVVYGGFGSTLGDGNYYGWKDSNVSEFSANLIDYLVNTPLLPSPGVSNVSHSPQKPTASQTVTVSCEVTGIGPAISQVNLRYSVNGSYYVQESMSNAGGSTWSATIPRMPAGAVVTYYVQAIDSAGNYGYWPTEPGKSDIGWYVVQGGIVDHIVISEVCYDPPGTDGNYEFLELYNPFPAAVSLVGWRAQAQNGNGNWTDTSDPLPVGSMIPAYGYFLMAKSEYEGWGADFIMDITMQNGPGSDPWGDSVRIYDANWNVVDRVCWDDESPVIPGLNTSMYESWPAYDAGSGSLERLPGYNDPLAGNWQDTDNNSADFIYRKFVDAQGTSSPPEYPPWVGDVTSPYLLPDDHPAYQSSAAQTPPTVTGDASVPNDLSSSGYAGAPDPGGLVGLLASMLLLLAPVVFLYRRNED